MNIYEMYYRNNKQFGFWVKRDSWSKTIAKVISIEGVKEGEDINGIAPYFNNPKVVAEYYKEFQRESCHTGNLDNVSELSCAGNYTYRLVANF